MANRKATHKKKAKKSASKKTSKKKPRLSRWQIFCLGIVVGLGLYWIPFEESLSSVQFTKTHWSSPENTSVFASQLPITTPLLKREGYATSYDGRTRNPYWVYHKLTEEALETKTSRTHVDFREDLIIPKHIRASKSDYKGSGYDRGHICPAADSPSQYALEETFLLTNIAPQTPSFNRGYWKKVEHHIRSLAREYRAVHVFSGPLYLPEKNSRGEKIVSYQVIGSHNVAVPTHFFSLIFVETPSGKMQAKGYILPNKTIDSHTPLKKYSASVEEIETASGVIFTHLIEKD